jgi:HEAT repeat protein
VKRPVFGTFLVGLLIVSAGLPATRADESQADHQEAAERIADEIKGEIIEGIRGEFGHAPCDPKWIDSLTDAPSPWVFIAQIIALDRCDNLVPSIVDLLRHENSSLREAAIWLVAEMEVKDATRTVEAMVEDPDTGVARQALSSACELSGVRCDSLVRGVALSERDWRLRYAALIRAEERGIDFDTGELLGFLNDESDRIVFQGLGMIPCERLVQEPFIGTVLLLLERPDRWAGTSWVLSRCPSRAAADRLMNLFATKVEAIGETDEFNPLIEAVTACAGSDARPLIEEYVLRHASSADKASIGASNIVTPLERAVRSLGRVGSEESRAALGHALDDPYYRVRKAAIVAIEKLGLQCQFEDELKQIAVADRSELVRERAIVVLIGCIGAPQDEEGLFGEVSDAGDRRSPP